MTWTKLISWLTGSVVLALSITSFILSYTALKDVAGVSIATSWTWLWPLVVDGALVVFALVVVHFSLNKQSVIVPLVLVLLFTVLTILFNGIHAGHSGVGVAVAIIPPIALFFSFEMFMWIVKSGIERHEVNDALDKLETKKKRLQTAVDKLTTQQDNLKDTIKDLKTKAAEVRTEPGQTLLILGVEPDNLRHAPDKRQPIIRQMLDNDIPKAQIIETLGISDKTLSRDIKSLSNGQ